MTKRQRETAPDWYVDLEGEAWDVPLSACALSERGDEIYYEGRDSWERIAQDSMRLKGTWFAHAGGIYDFPCMLNYVKARQITMSGNSILACDFPNATRWRDTFPAWQNPLKKVGAAVGLPKLELNRSQLQSYTKQQLREYNLRDCQILGLGVQHHKTYLRDNGADLRWTSGGAALALLKAMEPGTWVELTKHRLHCELLIELLDAVSGGRVEAVRGRRPVVYSYDIKSSYPSRYANQALGIGAIKISKPTKRDVENPHAILHCEWTWGSKTEIAPALDDLTHAGYGNCSGWLVYEERQMLLDSPTCLKFRARHGFKAQKSLMLGAEFVADLYARKEAGDFLAKCFINSLHGKFSESPVKPTITGYQPRDWFRKGTYNEAGEECGIPVRLGADYWEFETLDADEYGNAAPHSQPVAAAQILGRARADIARIMRAIQAAGFEVYYCDTDSVHTNCPPDKMPIPLGKALGQLAFEGGPFEGIYLGPKAYLLIPPEGLENAPGKAKCALKGVPLKALALRVDEAGKPIAGGKCVDGIFSEWRDSDAGKPEEMRLRVFEAALSGGARVQKEGIHSFKTGAKIGEWKRKQIIRTINPSGRGRIFDDAGNWEYASPDDLV